MNNKLNIVILAAGKGTRMRSKLLKVLHPLAGKTVIEHVIDTARKLNPAKVIVVHGHQGERLQDHLKDQDVHWVHQENPKGTGHAVQLAMPHIKDDEQVLILVGDAPLICESDLSKLLNFQESVLTAVVDDPHGYGRIIKNPDGLVIEIVEEKDASPVQKQINEINSGIIYANSTNLKTWLDQINSNNAQNELYLTDVLAIAHNNGKSFNSISVQDEITIGGINDRKQLAFCENAIQNRHRNDLMKQGAYLPFPESVQIRGVVNCQQDVTIDCGVILEGENSIAEDVVIGPYCVIKNCQLGSKTRIAAHSILENVVTKGDCDIGPFARLRPGTVLGEKAKVGNFVETKKTTIGKNSKASHLTYLGDCEIGNDVNIGAGTITCNYDGVNKFKTIIEDGAFIGSDSQLVAPVTVGKGATIGAGTTLTKDAEAEKLTLSRSKQKTIPNWEKPTKK